MTKNYAVIDLGTNTFHLLIAGWEQGQRSFHTVFRERRFVNLAQDGIETIGQAPFQRGLETLFYFKSQIKKYQVEHTVAVGTAALRTASNGKEFVGLAKKNAGIDVLLIDGDREAELIGKGVVQAIPDMGLQNLLIMDIGGGSVEFIISNKLEVFWAGSFPIGVAVLLKAFHHSDPIHHKEIELLERFLEQKLRPLREALKKYPCQILVGASGTFDVLDNFIMSENRGDHYSAFDRFLFTPLYQHLIVTTKSERLAMEKIPEERVEMLIAALVLIRFVLEMASIKEIVVSAYALKEGLLSEMMFEKSVK